MRDPFRWSISLGRWGSPTVRLHIFFVVFALATCYLSWDASTIREGGNLLAVALAAILLLFFSVLLHEWSHWWVARRYGTAPETLVLGPLGGLSEWNIATGSRGEFACLIAGPLANLLVCLVCAGLLRALFPQLDLVPLFSPLQPVGTGLSSPLLEQGLRLCFWINWLLFLFNLLPAFPFDGGHVLRSAISSLRPAWSDRRVAEIVFWIAIALATVIMASSLILWKENTGYLSLISFGLLLLGVVLLVSARRDVENAAPRPPDEVYDTELEDPWPVTASYDEPVEEPSDGRPRPSESSEPDPWRRNLALPEDPTCQQEVEAEEERQVDRILSRLHAHGMDSLTSEERQLLERVSARYRSRLGRHI